MKKILILDDEPHLRELYRKELQAHGYLVATASHLHEAEKTIRAQKVDLVILDLKLDNEFGFDFFHSVLSRKKDIKVIIHTAYPMFKSDFRSWGADAFLVKSSNVTELLQTVGRLLTQAQEPIPAP
ncbi:MAG: response regulator [candidate division KSB1 bacterium]|nr:response regulator [candidate division KSB1 bacterium]MDQ7063976.1 response regulator [candidate division KSB1 bacterium]